MTETPILITVTGQKSGAKVRININNITKYRENDGGGTSFFTYKDDGTPYMVAKEKISIIDDLVHKAIEEQINLSKPAPYSLKP